MKKVVYGNGNKCKICRQEVEKWGKNRCKLHMTRFGEWYKKNKEYQNERTKQSRIKKLL
jgi:hypothetical protein